MFGDGEKRKKSKSALSLASQGSLNDSHVIVRIDLAGKRWSFRDKHWLEETRRSSRMRRTRIPHCYTCKHLATTKETIRIVSLSS